MFSWVLISDSCFRSLHHMPNDRKTDKASAIRTLGALSAVGIAFVLAVVIGATIGYWLDRLTGLSPLFFILFFFFGLAAGIVNVVRTASGIGSSPKKPPLAP